MNKYKCVQEWFEQKRMEALSLDLQNASDYEKKAWYKKQSFEIEVAGFLIHLVLVDCMVQRNSHHILMKKTVPDIMLT